jgi:GNAT superfamily N-acetyltransferase
VDERFMDATLSVCQAPTEEVREAILTPLAAFNAANGYPADLQCLAITLQDCEGTVVGGLWGGTIYDWLFIDYLVVPASMRGRNLGSELIGKAEEIALERGCVGSWLTTFSFQAKGFYERLGYEVFGSLENSPRDNSRIFLRKRLLP